MSNHQRQKGKAGEREFAKVLRELGFDARRSQQYSGEGGTADLVTSIPNLHVEVKRRTKIGAARFMDQAERDWLDSDIPLIAMREDGGEWLVVIKAKDLTAVARKIRGIPEM